MVLRTNTLEVKIERVKFFSCVAISVVQRLALMLRLRLLFLISCLILQSDAKTSAVPDRFISSLRGEFNTIQFH